MKITVIYATPRKTKSSTYNLAQRFINQLSGEDAVTEFFLPKDMPDFCVSCWNCFTDHTRCPHYNKLQPIISSMLEADLLVFTAPVYVFHLPAQLKALLDHCAYQWMSHQPRKEMFGKRALLISTASGAGTSSTLRDINDSMTFWGISKVYRFGRNIMTSDWDIVSEKRRQKLLSDADKLADRIKSGKLKTKTSLKVKTLFYVMRFMQKVYKFNPADVNYWEKQDWLGKKRPWK
ncbi:MAG: flavodoxin family protein [Eubacteriales bacterium]